MLPGNLKILSSNFSVKEKIKSKMWGYLENIMNQNITCQSPRDSATSMLRGIIWAQINELSITFKIRQRTRRYT